MAKSLVTTFQKYPLQQFLHSLLNLEGSKTEAQKVLLKTKYTIKSYIRIKYLPNDYSLTLFKLKSIADDKINVTLKLNFFIGWVENIVGKGENAGYQHFLLFPQFFQKFSFAGSLKIGTVWYRVNAST